MTTNNHPNSDQRKWERVREGTPQSRNGIKDGSLRGIYYDRHSRRFRARYADASGNWKWQQFCTLKEAQRHKFKADEARETSLTQKTLARDRVTFKQLAAAYTKAKLNPPVYLPSDNGQTMVKEESGRANWREGVRAMRAFESHFGSRLITSIKRHEILAWKEARKNEPTQRINIDKTTGKRKPRSYRDVHQAIHFLRHAFNYAIEQGWATENPASDAGVKQRKLINAKLERERDRVLHDDERVRLFEAVNDPFLKAVLIFLLNTGIRIEEAEKVERGMIKLDHNEIGHIYLPARVTKNKEARDLPMFTVELRDVILDRFAAIDSKDDALLFGEITDRCDDNFEAARAAAGIEDFLMRDCRPTFATEALRVLPMPYVMKIAGWKNSKTLLRYCRPTPDAHKENAASFAAHRMQRQVKMAAYMASHQVEQPMAYLQVN